MLAMNNGQLLARVRRTRALCWTDSGTMGWIASSCSSSILANYWGSRQGADLFQEGYVVSAVFES